MPATDEGEVRVDVEMESGTRLSLFDEKMKEIEKITTESVPEIKNMVTSVGASWRGGKVEGRLRISLKPQAERKRSSDEIANFIQQKLKNIPGVVVRSNPGRGFFLLRRSLGGDEKIAVEVLGHNLEITSLIASDAADMIKDIEGVKYVRYWMYYAGWNCCKQRHFAG